MFYLSLCSNIFLYLGLSSSEISKVSNACSKLNFKFVISFLIDTNMPFSIPFSMPFSSIPWLKLHISLTSSLNFPSIVISYYKNQLNLLLQDKYVSCCFLSYSYIPKSNIHVYYLLKNPRPIIIEREFLFHCFLVLIKPKLNLCQSDSLVFLFFFTLLKHKSCSKNKGCSYYIVPNSFLTTCSWKGRYFNTA